MNVPDELKYSRTDEWVNREDEVVTIGITDYAQNELGEIVYVELPEVGASVTPDAPFGVVESVKAVAELVAPVGGEVIAVNEQVTDNPSLINDSPYIDGWMLKIKIADAAPLASLMDAAEYAEYRSNH